MLSEEELKRQIEGCVLNDRKSQKKIYAAFYGFAMSICVRYTTSHEDAIEIINDSFLKVFIELYRFKPAYTSTTGSFKGWLRKVIAGTAIDHYRKNQKQTLVTSLEEGFADVADTSVTIPEKISFRELSAAIAGLTPAYRAIVNLFIIDGFSHEEIAKMLDISVGTSKSNLFKAKKQLQKILLNQHQINERYAV